MGRRDNIRPLTSKGIQLIESGEMDYFHPESYSNFNTTVLEEFFEEKNRKESFDRSHFKWWKLVIMIIIIGIPFIFITQFIAMKVGLVLSSVFYVSYVLGTALRWKPTEVNIISSSTNLVDQTVVGFAYVFPAIFLLARVGEYAVSENTRTGLESALKDPSFFGMIIIISLFTSLVSVFYFVVMRRLWIVEDPLPTPGFESNVKLMDLTHSISKGLKEKARRSLIKMGIAGGSIFVFAFLREYPIFKESEYVTLPILDKVIKSIGFGKWYSFGYVQMPLEEAKYTHISLWLSGLAFSIGWFMRFRTAFMIFLGSAFVWLFVVPLAIVVDVPYFWPITGEYFHLSDLIYFFGLDVGGDYVGIDSTPAYGAFRLSRDLAVGCIMGAGVTALIKISPALRGISKNFIGRKLQREKGWVPGKGWFDWPTAHLKLIMPISFMAILIALILMGGFHPVPSIIVAFFLTVGALILYLVTVKIAGESGIGPTLAILMMGILILYIMLDVFEPTFLTQDQAIILTLIGITAFGAGMVAPIAALWDFKTGHYIGTRPMHLIKGQSVAILVGIPISIFIAVKLSEMMVMGEGDFLNPYPRAFATFITIMTGGHVFVKFIIIGIIVGALVELVTGKGTVFGLGMFFPIGFPLMLLIGGSARDIWERRLDKRLTEEQLRDGTKSIKVLDSYLIMTGIFVGEALIGLLLTIYYLS